MSKNVVELLLKVRDQGLSVIKQYSDQLEKISESQKEAQKTTQKLDDQLDGLKKSTDKAGNAADDFARKTKKGTESIKDSARASGQAVGKQEQLKRSTQSLSESMGDVAKKAAAAAAVVASFAAIKGNADAMFELKRDADLLNIAIEDLSALQFAASQGAGVSAEMLGDGLRDLSEKIADFAAVGGGGAADFFRQVNINAEELNRLNPGEQLLAIADALKDFSTNDRNKVLDQLGSDNLRNLAPLIADGGEEFRKLMGYAKETGIAINGTDVKRMAAFSREAAKSASLTASLWDRATAAVSPVFTEITRGFNAVLEDILGGIGETEDKLNTASQITAVFAGLVEKVYLNFKLLTVSFARGINAAVIEFEELFDWLDDKWESIFGDSIERRIKSAERLKELFELNENQSEEGLKKIRDLEAEILDLKKQQGEQGNKEESRAERKARRLEVDKNLAKQQEEASLKASYTVPELIAASGKRQRNDIELLDAKKEDGSDEELKRILTQEQRDAANQLKNQREANALSAADYEIEQAIRAAEESRDAQLANLDLIESANAETTDNIIEQRIAAEIEANNKILALNKQRIENEIAEAERLKGVAQGEADGAANAVDRDTFLAEAEVQQGTIDGLKRELAQLERSTAQTNANLSKTVVAERSRLIANLAKIQKEGAENAAQADLEAQAQAIEHRADMETAALEAREALELESSESIARKKMAVERRLNEERAANEVAQNQLKINALIAQQAAYEAAIANNPADSVAVLNAKTQLADLDNQIGLLNTANAQIQRNLAAANTALDQQIDLSRKVEEAQRQAKELEDNAKLLEAQKKFDNVVNENRAQASLKRIEIEKLELDALRDMQMQALSAKTQLDRDYAGQAAIERLKIEEQYNEQSAALALKANAQKLNALKALRAQMENELKGVKPGTIEAVELNTQLAELDGRMAEVNAAAEIINREAENQNALIEAQIDTQEQINAAEEKAKKVEDLANQLQVIRDKFASGGLTFGEFENAATPVIDEIQGSLDGLDDSRIEQLSDLITKVKGEFNEIQAVGQLVGKSLVDNFVNGIDQIIDGTKSIGDVFRDMARQVVSELAKIYAKQLLVKSVEMFGGAAGGGDFLSGILTGLFHSGGIAGQSSGLKRKVSPLAFANPTYYHTGGIAGLKADEVPAVLRKGEEVLTETDPRHRNNYNGNQGSTPQAVNITNSIDGKSIVDAFEGNGGESVIMNVIRANRNEIKAF